jgi:molybdenum cofactor cytidylyltransferase
MGQPKALLRLGGQTFLQLILGTIRQAGLTPRFLVLGSDHGKILEQHDLDDVIVLTNLESKSGPIGSIRTTIAEFGSGQPDGLLVWPVDLPHVSLATIKSMVGQFVRARKPITVPTFNGRRGHPTLFGAEIFAELVGVPEGLGANSVVRREPNRVLEVAVPDPAVVARVNTPEDYERLRLRESKRDQ